MKTSLVIPGRNSASTLRECLGSIMSLLRDGTLEEVIFVDDGSTDATATIAAEYPIRVLHTPGVGPGAARNVGWRAAAGDLIWFIDSDCVPEPGALEYLLRHFDRESVAGVGGSYANVRRDSLLACLIHEEIRERHLSTSREVDYLGSFNVLYRRAILEEVGGFDEREFNAPRAPGAEDADLSYRIADRGHLLLFEPLSLVGHFHPTRLSSYLRSQRLHGVWGVRLYYRHRGRASRNSYSGWTDHLQPVVAFGALILLPGLLVPGVRMLSLTLIAIVAALQAPMAIRLVRRTRDWRYLGFVPLSVIRAAARGIGLAQSSVRLLWDRPAPASAAA